MIKRYLFSSYLALLCIVLVANGALSQTNPDAQSLPYSQDFGTVTFTNVPNGMAAWQVSPVQTLNTTAAVSTPNNNSSVAAATAPTATAGSYGYATEANGRFYIQTYGSGANATNQLALAVNCSNNYYVKVSYDVEMINPGARTGGVVLSYRVGTSGTWTIVANSTYSHSSTDRTSGQVDNFSVYLPVATDNQGYVELRWATFERDQGTTYTGMAIDNISVTGLPASVFRSKQSGNWNQLSTWEMSSDSTTWTDATVYPDYRAKSIVIQNNHSVSITSSETIDQVIVNGTLKYTNTTGVIPIINNGPGTDLVINRKFEDNGNSAITWNTGATWSIGSGDTLLRTRSVNGDHWRDHYEGGISNITPSAYWIYKRTISEYPYIIDVDMTYPNLVLECEYSPSWAYGSTSPRFYGSGTPPVIKGGFYIGGNGTYPITFTELNSNASPVLVKGDLVVKAGSAITISGTSASLEVQGNVYGYGTITASSGTLIMGGSNNQTVYGTAGSDLVIHRWKINKTSGQSTVTLNTPVRMYYQLDLIKGRIVTSSTTLLKLWYGNGININGANDSSYVEGPVSLSTLIGGYTFPTGKNFHYRPVTLDNVPYNTRYYTAEFFNSGQSNGNSKAISLDSLSNCEYWVLSTTETGAASANISLTTGSTSCYVNQQSTGFMRIARWNGSQWTDLGNSSTTEGKITTNSVFNLCGQGNVYFTLAQVSEKGAYYESKQSGDFNSASSWRISGDLTHWRNATIAPDYNANLISIRSQDSLYINQLDSVNQLTVNGVLNYQNGQLIIVDDNTASDFTINGKFYFQSANSIGFNNASAKWSIGANGSMIITSGASNDNLFTTYSSGISNIPATAKWILRKTGSGNPQIYAAASSYYPSLIIENFTESPWVTSGNSSFRGTLIGHNIKGTFDLGGSGTSTVNFLDNHNGATTTKFLGDFIIRAGNTFRNQGTGIKIFGNLLIDGNIDWVGGSSSFELSGTQDQTISGANPITFYNLTLNKTNCKSITLNAPVTVQKYFNLNKGILNTSNTNIIHLPLGSYAQYANDSGYVNGPVKRTGNTAFTFPTGKGNNYQPISISAPSSTEASYTAEYFSTQQSLGSAKESTIDSVSTCEYWSLNNVGTAYPVNVTLNWDNRSCNIADGHMRLALWDGSKWTDKGNSSTTSGAVTSQTALNSFGNFALAQEKTNFLDITINTIDETDSTLGMITTLINNGVPPFKFILNESSFNTISELNAAWQNMDGIDSLNLGNVKTQIISNSNGSTISNLRSGIYYLSVIDSTQDTITKKIQIGKKAQWVNTNGIQINNATLTKIASDSWDNAEPISSSVLNYNNNGAVAFNLIQTTGISVIGLRPLNDSLIQGYLDVRYGMYFDNGVIKIINNKNLTTTVGDYQSTDQLMIEKVGTVLSFYKNENIIYQIQNVNTDLVLDINIFTQGTGVNVSKLIGFIADPPVINFDIKDPSCYGINSGSIQATLNVTPTFVSWTGPNGFTANSLSIGNLSPGFYRLTITYLAHYLLSGLGIINLPATYSWTVPIGIRALWTNLVNSTSNSTNDLINTSNINSWNSSAGSINKLSLTQDGWFIFSNNTQNYINYISGLCSINNTTSTSQVQYGVNIYKNTFSFNLPGGPITISLKFYQIIESGIVKYVGFDYLSGDFFRIEKVGTQIKYFKNFSSVPFYISLNSPTQDLYAVELINSKNLSVLQTKMSFDCGTPDFTSTYFTLKSQLDGGFYDAHTNGNKLHFKYNGEYNSGNLTFCIYKYDRTVLSANTYNGTPLNISCWNSIVKNFGDNRYSIDLSNCTGFNQNDEFYFLEVKDENNHKYYLKFKY